MKKLFFAILLLLSCALSYAQVGVNTDDPSKTLDVNGELRIRTTPKAQDTIKRFPLAVDRVGNVVTYENNISKMAAFKLKLLNSGTFTSPTTPEPYFSSFIYLNKRYYIKASKASSKNGSLDSNIESADSNNMPQMQMLYEFFSDAGYTKPTTLPINPDSTVITPANTQGYPDTFAISITNINYNEGKITLRAVRVDNKMSFWAATTDLNVLMINFTK